MSTPYTAQQHSRILEIATRLLQGWARVPSDYEIGQCLKKAEHLYLESLKVGIPEIEAAPPIVEV